MSSYYCETHGPHTSQIHVWGLGDLGSLLVTEIPVEACLRVLAQFWEGTMFWSKEVTEVTQSCPTLCDPMDSSLPGFSIHGIFQARVPEWVAISLSIKGGGALKPQGRVLAQATQDLEAPWSCCCSYPLAPSPRATPWVLVHMWAECLAKAEGCWKSGCFLGSCLACPLKVKLGAPGRCPERRQAGVAPALGFEWSPLLSQSLFLSGLFTQPTTAGWCQGWG